MTAQGYPLLAEDSTGREWIVVGWMPSAGHEEDDPSLAAEWAPVVVPLVGEVGSAGPYGGRLAFRLPAAAD